MKRLRAVSVSFFLSLLFVVSCDGYKNVVKVDSDFNERILEVTKNGLLMYLVLNGKNQKGQPIKYLITSLELRWVAFLDLDLETSYIDKLRVILENNCNLDVIKDIDQSSLIGYAVNKKHLKSLRKFSKYEVYQKFFDSTSGMAKENVDEEELKAAVAFLIEHRVVVYQGPYSMYNIFVIR